MGRVAENLRISEIMYHPRETGSPTDADAECIELTNSGDRAININGVRFTKGIDFLFPDIVLKPDDYVLVVKDIEAFVTTYDTTRAVVVGSYAGRLSNSGERLKLVDADGQEIQSIKYDDHWYELTDGLGFSLTLINPADHSEIDWSNKSLWRPSVSLGGSPGWDDSGN
ncbi:lamin tail domain-containing protein [Planctomycetota bacterium]